MAEREDLELQRGPAPERSEKRRAKSGQQVPKWESKGEQQLPVYQSNRSLRELHSAAPATVPPPIPGNASLACAKRSWTAIEKPFHGSSQNVIGRGIKTWRMDVD
jgi:hypothetical protein